MHRLVAWLIGHGGRVVAGVLVVSLALGLAAVRLELGLPHVQFRLAGGFIGIMAAIYDEILRSQARMTVASFLVIFLVLVPTYRSVTAAVLLIIPLALANVVVNAYMAARGIGLDLNTLPVIGVGVGFGIDYGIYVLSRVCEAVRAGATLEAATHEALRHAGRTVAFTAVTMTAGM